MDLAFISLPLRDVCENEEIAIQELDKTIAEMLKHRLADLRAAVTINDLIVGNPRVFPGNPQNTHMVIDLYGGYQLVFCANHPNNPFDTDGNIDWQRVSRIKILRIEMSNVK